MASQVTVRCPYCGYESSLKIGPFTNPPYPKLANWRERMSYGKKRMNLNRRRKDCFPCPKCAKIIISAYGKFYKSEDVDEALYNKIYCHYCGAEIDYRKCYREELYEWGGYKAYCSKCAWKEWKKRIIFIVCLLGGVYISLYWVMFRKLPDIRLW